MQNHKKRRGNESPLTFIRSHPDSKIFKSNYYSSRTNVAAKWLEQALFFCEESMASLNSQSGTQFRESIYCLHPMLDHEQFDTMGIRLLGNYFVSDEKVFAVPRLDPQAYSERYYLLRLSEAEEPVAVISIQHAIEELLERCVFLRDPSTTWVCRPSKLHVLLATTTFANVTEEERQCKKVAHATSPVQLKLKRFMWRRQGTLWVQWHCTQGNVDRLRADLRIASGGTVRQCFTPVPEEDPCLGRPFALETLVMATLQKPTKEEFSQLVRVTGDMQRMFEGVTVNFTKIARVCQIHDQLDRDALNGEQSLIQLAPSPQIPPQTFVDHISRSFFLATHSPSVRRIVISFFISSALVGSIAAAFIHRKFR